MNVVILGCGPAGLLAAHAAYVLGGKGMNVKIISLKRKSPMAGAQFIHRAIPGIQVKGDVVEFRKWGTKEGYAQKVYDDINHPCSWDSFPAGVAACWPMKGIYEHLWERWEDKIVDMRVTIHGLHEIEQEDWDLMISTIPLPAICVDPTHKFDHSTVYINAKKQPSSKTNGNIVVYNGRFDNSFYRCSSLFGNFAMEWGSKQMAPINAVEVRKPQSNDCDCWPRWMRAGRYGKWERGVLVHHVYEEVYGALLQVQ